MDKTLAGLLGAVGAFTAAGPAAASPAVPQDMAAAMTADSYAALLRPIPNAAALLRAAQADAPQTADEPEFDAPATVQTVQYHDQQPPMADHHHHHHHYIRHRRHHHVLRPVPPPPIVGHHHHHHHNSSAMLDRRLA